MDTPGYGLEKERSVPEIKENRSAIVVSTDNDRPPEQQCDPGWKLLRLLALCGAADRDYNL